MPLNDLIWDCGNDFDTEVTYKKGTAVQAKPNAGVCAGQSALWCYNLQSGVRDIFSKPDLMRAMILQRLYDWHNDRGQLCGKVGLSVDLAREFGRYKTACEYMESNKGTYYITLYGHGVAAHHDNAFKYFFDPNFGCYRFGAAGRMLKLARRSRSAVGINRNEGMKIFKVSLQS